MSEAMTVETIVEAYWRMQGYWTKLRFPFKATKGGWSDIDILAYNPEEKILIMSESKVRGPKSDVYVYTGASRKKYGNIFDFDEGSGYLSFLNHLKAVCSDGVLFSNFKRMVDKLVIQLVSNYLIEDSIKSDVVKDISKKIRNSIPKKVDYGIRLDTTFDIICEVIKVEKGSIQGRRYGHPVIDMAREINRYHHPNIKCAGRDKKSLATIRKNIKSKWDKALNG